MNHVDMYEHILHQAAKCDPGAYTFPVSGKLAVNDLRREKL